MLVVYEQEGKYAIFNGIRFCRDDSTGYYLSGSATEDNKCRMRLHRYIYEQMVGPIPDGYDIHHIDKDKGNNELSNLLLMKSSEHRKLHGSELTEDQRKSLRQNLLETAIPAASKWHRSEKGREWHKQHYNEFKEKLHVRGNYVCEYCGKTFVAKISTRNRFCSNACKSAWRRASGIDDEIRYCECCGRAFTVNKYKKTQTCSRVCADRLRQQKRAVTCSMDLSTK